jgi:DNA-binding response OmpR family regulator
MKRVLIVDDDADLRRLVKTYSVKEGFTCDEAASGQAALEQMSLARYDIIILDVMMPEKDGLSTLSELRNMESSSGSPDTPVIILTARKEEYDKLLGFKLGADDYVSKPFSPAELMARIKAVLKRCKLIMENCLHFGKMEIREAEMVRDITWNDENLKNEDLNLILREANRLSLMVDDIMDYSQLQSGYSKLHKTPVNLYEIIVMEVDYIKNAASAYDIHNITVNIDGLKTSQVLRNLFNNAINHTKDNDTITIDIAKKKILLKSKKNNR